MRDGTLEGCRNQAPSLSGESLSPGSEKLGLDSGPGLFALQTGESVVSSWGFALAGEMEISPSTQFPCTNDADWSETALAPGWKVWHPQDPLVLPPFCRCPGSWVLISADAPRLKTHIWHPVGKHSTKKREIKAFV